MLNRRTFIQMAAAIGLNSIVPIFQPSRASVSNFNPVGSGIQVGGSIKNGTERLMAIERWENLQDDLDCIELAARYTWQTSVAGKMTSACGETLSFYAHCPFCSSNDSLYLREDSYHCCDCQLHG